MRYPNGIRSHRLRSQFTQRDVAARVGGSRGMVSAWEHGYMLPTVLNLFRLARALGAPCEALYPRLASGDAAREPAVKSTAS